MQETGKIVITKIILLENILNFKIKKLKYGNLENQKNERIQRLYKMAKNYEIPCLAAKKV